MEWGDRVLAVVTATKPDFYGSDVGDRTVEFLADRADDRPFEWAHERQGFAAATDREFDYL